MAQPYHPASDIHERHTPARDLAHLFIGKPLGLGMSRWVYEHASTDKFVIKFEPAGDDFQNVLEWRIWQSVKPFPKLARWFAPCEEISQNGIWLIMRRVIQPVPKHRLPKRIPDFLGDLKTANFGLLGGKVVACDYGYPSLSRMLIKNEKLVKADWWEADT